VLRTPTPPAPQRLWRSPPTRRSSALRSGSAARRPPGSPRSIRSDEEKMLERVLREIPKLTDAASAPTSRTTRLTTSRRQARLTRCARLARPPASERPGRRRAPSGPRVRHARCPALLRLRAGSGRRRLGRRPRDRALRQADGRRRHRQAPRALADRSGQDRGLRAKEPEPHHDPQPPDIAARRRTWAGYDELTAPEVIALLAEGDDDRAEQVRSSRAHKNRGRRPDGR
jgi:hypothetical protein